MINSYGPAHCVERARKKGECKRLGMVECRGLLTEPFRFRKAAGRRCSRWISDSNDNVSNLQAHMYLGSEMSWCSASIGSRWRFSLHEIDRKIMLVVVMKVEANDSGEFPRTTHCRRGTHSGHVCGNSIITIRLPQHHKESQCSQSCMEYFCRYQDDTVYEDIMFGIRGDNSSRVR